MEQQDPDGHWRDYELVPGRSESWMTACVGVAVSTAYKAGVSGGDCNAAVDRAAVVLKDTRRRSGWGYNTKTACDADSTSWVVRFLVMRDIDPGPSPLFDRYLTSLGGVRTFPSPRAHGYWADEHDEVAPMAGSALLALGDDDRAARIRSRILSRYRDHGVWLRFWWDSKAYVSAQNLTFLARTGGIPDRIASAEQRRLQASLDRVERGGGSSFDMSQSLLCAFRLGAPEAVSLLCRGLLANQLADGGWTASPGLLVPDRWDVDVPTETFVDDRRLFSTAMSVIALLEVTAAIDSNRNEEL
ncbi:MULTISPECIES: hypothetical protein [Nocardia]|uniref:hypothetical protein n=1 Tax=Nocardia TaxID=1817 RepID=UPI0018934E41|nr:hypothetical protein [Nocardia flavorosea]MBF6351349.1 hypothetical protein [Nocardia flavorosea]